MAVQGKTSPALSSEMAHKVLWCLAESHFRQAQSAYKNTQLPATASTSSKEWRGHVIAGLSCLYGLLRLCEAPRDQAKYFGSDLVIGPDTEARTRLRIAQILSEWADSTTTGEGDVESGEEERQLTRALMAVPSGSAYVDTRYAIITAQCRLFMRRREFKWAEQRIKASLTDAQQRGQHQWVHHFALELASIHLAKGDGQSATSTLQASVLYAQRTGDKLSATVALVQQLGIVVQARSWSTVDPLLGALDDMSADPALASMPQIKTQFWVLKAAAMQCRGRLADAQEACNCARQALMEWQGVFARQLATGRASSGGSLLVQPNAYTNTTSGSADGHRWIRGWCYYEAHAWVMLMSAFVVQVQDTYEPALGFLRLALEGIARGEADGATRQLLQLKLHIFLRLADVGIAALSMSDAKHALDQALVVVAKADHYSSSQAKPNADLWRSSRDAIALRWAMYLHRTGHSDEAMGIYRCVIRGRHSDLRFAAQVNLVVLQLADPEPLTLETRQAVHSVIAELVQTTEKSSNGSHEAVHRALLELLQGIETEEPVKAKTHLLACLRISSDTADSVLQGWTLCLLGTLVLPAGQYEQAMRMCAAGQAIAQSANDPLQKAAAIGILSHIENAVGDPDRCTKLLQIDQQCLEQFNARILDN
ncbi:hypothetical protein GGI20_005668 [Coemansia sp. BCRC 34301]|nr:hypothetical protein GGI20_005668 [Coemansia sp. BCRC 34301]